MNEEKNESLSEDNDASQNEKISSDRRKALTKLAYGSPAIAALLMSKSAAAQASCTNPRPRFLPPCAP